jgi:hypothetical protein
MGDAQKRFAHALRGKGCGNFSSAMPSHPIGEKIKLPFRENRQDIFIIAADKSNVADAKTLYFDRHTPLKELDVRLCP